MSVLQKTNRILQIILGAFLLIVFRIWHLAVIQRDERLIEAQKPQRRVIVQRADRGTICDRFGIPLALNRICTNATIYYGQFSSIPSVASKTDENKVRQKIYPRREYIHRLSEMLAHELELDAERIEDLIHAKASLFPHAPFTIKANLTESEYYRLKALEREWAGLHTEIASERHYPLGKTASNVLGYLGAISQQEFVSIAHELDSLRQAIEEGNENGSLLARYRELKEKAYTLSDRVGKTGIEAEYEEDLRGLYGKKVFEVDQKGNSLRELPGAKPPIPGQNIALSLSAELQQFCESLLIQDERTRDGRSIGVDPKEKVRKILKQPWIKGGAIVALDPESGEVIALAATPRFDPNDFIPTSNQKLQSEKWRRIRRWHESDRAIGDLWDGLDWLYRERPGTSARGIAEENAPLSWDLYLQFVLPTDGPLRLFWSRNEDVKTMIQLQEDFESLLYFAGHPDPLLLMDILFPSDAAKGSPKAKETVLETLKQNIEDAALHRRHLENALHSIPSNSDRLFTLDLCRLAVYSPAFTDKLIAKMGSMRLSEYRHLVQSLCRIESALHSFCKIRFHQTTFAEWRKANQKHFLIGKRKEEKERKTYARPYLDYLDQKEREEFEAFWQQERLELLCAMLKQNSTRLTETTAPYFDLSLNGLSDWEPLRAACSKLDDEETTQFLRTLRPFADLGRPLWGRYRSVRGKIGEQLERDLAAAFYPVGGFGFSRSHAFQTSAPLGSIFKLVTAYEMMRQREQSHEMLNPLTLYDEIRSGDKSLIVALTADQKPIYRHYKGGRLPRSHLPHIGKIDLLGAIEQSSNPYFSLLASDYLHEPEDLKRAAALFGFGSKTGIDLPDEWRGALPADLATNRTGLYSFAIGQHTLVTTPLQAAVMLAAIANGGKCLQPRMAKSFKGARQAASPLDAFSTSPSWGKEEWAMLGIDFPLLTASQPCEDACKCSESQAEIRRTIPFPPSIRNLLLEGMDRTVWGAKGTARVSAVKALYTQPLLLRDYLSLQHQMIGKTSTAEIVCNLSAAPSSSPQMYKHIWFGGISFPTAEPLKHHWEKSDLVVMVYLRYGDGGKEAAPLAAQVIKKWREIRLKHQM